MATEHLGDGAFVTFDGYQYWLGANDPQNMTVALEPQALISFVRYVKRTTPALAAMVREELANIPGHDDEGPFRGK